MTTPPSSQDSIETGPSTSGGVFPGWLVKTSVAGLTVAVYARLYEPLCAEALRLGIPEAAVLPAMLGATVLFAGWTSVMVMAEEADSRARMKPVQDLLDRLCHQTGERVEASLRLVGDGKGQGG